MLPSRSAGAWLGVVVLLCTGAPVRAQDVTVGCWGAGGCDTTPDEPPLPCSTGVDCASGLCLESTCLPPLGGCSYCFDGLPSYCPDLFLGDVPSPIRGAFDSVLGTCSYAFCGDVAYVVRSGPPTISGLEDCLQMGGSWRLWGQGDCDSDGIPNELETGAGICEPDRVVGRARSTYVCADATFAVGADLGVAPRCPTAAPPLVAPDVGACPVDDAGFEAFGICCDTSDECPRLKGPWGVVRPVRCVRFGRGVGVCTYDGPTDLGDDSSCITHPPTASCLGGTSSVAFERWAEGDCDAECQAAETRNLDAPEVCSCSPPMPDAGVDAHVEPDAYVERPDARAPELDTGAPDGGPALDAAGSEPDGPPSFGGGGCRCTARRARTPGPLVAGVLLAFGVLSLSRRRIIGR